MLDGICEGLDVAPDQLLPHQEGEVTRFDATPSQLCALVRSLFHRLRDQRISRHCAD